jgi:hypothetical protein
MAESSLVTEEIDAAAQLVSAFGNQRPVKAAFWLKGADDHQRYLYIASDAIDVGNLFDAYLEVGRIARAMQSPWLDPLRVKLIAGDDPLALAATNILKKFPSPLPTRIAGGRFGDVTVDDVYIYPPSLPATVP